MGLADSFPFASVHACLVLPATIADQKWNLSDTRNFLIYFSIYSFQSGTWSEIIACIKRDSVTFVLFFKLSGLVLPDQPAMITSMVLNFQQVALNEFPEADLQIHMSQENAWFCRRMVEIAGKLSIHRLVNTVHFDHQIWQFQKEGICKNWRELSSCQKVQGCSGQWSPDIPPHLYTVTCFT